MPGDGTSCQEVLVPLFPGLDRSRSSHPKKGIPTTMFNRENVLSSAPTVTNGVRVAR
jgi:hypothetical protein